MSVICSRCSHAYSFSAACPRCGTVGPESAGLLHGPRWLRTSWGRILIGLVFAQGLFYGLRQFATGILLATSESTPEELWKDPQNQIILLTLQLFGILLGAVLAGGGQRSALVLGLITGVGNGILAMWLRQNPAQQATPLSLYGYPLLSAGVGALGGLIGSLIWRPIPITLPGDLAPKRKKVAKAPSKPWLAGRVLWLRVLLGTAAAIAGTLCTGILSQKLLSLSGSKLEFSAFQNQLIVWEVKALVLLGAGCLGGLTAPNGMKQGLLIGLLSSVALIGYQAPGSPRPVELALFTALSNFTLCAVGGWFGASLFPEVVKEDRRKRFY